MFSQFRAQYPTGSLISELLQIHEGNYIVRVLVQLGGYTLATGLAAHPNLEQAEDQARLRALAVLGLNLSAQAAVPQVAAVQGATVPPVVAPSPVAVSSPSPVPQPQVALLTDRETEQAQEALKPEQSTPVFQTEPEVTPPEPPVVVPLQPAVPEPTITEEFTLTNPVETVPELAANGGEFFESKDHSITQLEEFSVSSSDLSAETSNGSGHHVNAGQPSLTMLPETEDPDNDSFDFPGVSMKVGLELKRISWTPEQEIDYLKFAYGKQSRSLLSNSQLLEFLHYLQTFAQTTLELQRVGWDDQQGSGYLKKTYPKSKGSRRRLTYANIQEFYSYLQTLPSADDSLY